MDPLRPYDGWWWVADDGKQQTNNSSPKMETNTSISPSVTTSSSASPSEFSRESTKWTPLHARDNDALEKVLTSKSTSTELPIFNKSPHRLHKVNIQEMCMKPIYWDSSPVPVRRSIWIRMQSRDSSEDYLGGSPADPKLEKALEECFEKYKEWIHEPIQPEERSEKIERMAELPRPFDEWTVIFRKGDSSMISVQRTATISSPYTLISPYSLQSSPPIRYIRGYLNFYVSVIKSSHASKSTTTQSPYLPSPHDVPLADPINDVPIKSPKHLIFAIHGIGQKFLGKRGGSFSRDVSLMRETLQAALVQRGADPSDILVLPIVWRNALKLDTNYFSGGDVNVEENVDFDGLAKRITLESIPAIRELAADVGLDIMFYMLPAYYEKIMSVCEQEIKRIYKIYCEIGGQDAQNTSISLIGHSLGSAIASDLLMHRCDVNSNDEQTNAREKVKCRLGFEIEKFFAFGSPLPMLLLLKQLKPLSCLKNQKSIEASDDTSGPSKCCRPHKELSLDTTITTQHNDHGKREKQSLPVQNFIFACRSFYNVFHSYDPIAYRFEPLLITPEQMTQHQLPLKIPHYKRGALQLKRRIESEINTISTKATKVKNDLIDKIPGWIKERLTISKDAIDIGGDSSFSNATITGYSNCHILGGFNAHGRVDFALEEGIFENSYVSSLISHSCYWDDVDIANFIVSEIFPDLSTPY